MNSIKKTAIIATAGPATRDPKVLKALIQEGVNVFRLNFSHGSHKEHLEMLQNIRQVSKELGTFTGVLADLSGPKIRIGTFEKGRVYLKEGNYFEISTAPETPGTEERVYTNYPYFVQDVRVNDEILLNDGVIRLKAVSKTKDSIEFLIVNGGELKNHKGINLPNIPLSTETLTEKDKKDLEFILENRIDFVALSFVRKASDMKLLKRKVAPHPIQVVAKIEKPEALQELESIVDESDAIMIARGDLGVEMPIQEVPAIQKRIASLCFSKGIPVITATQMLESMISNPSPTRAETTDVFNAVLDGNDAVMLSGETAIGKYPVETVKTMTSIIREAEKFTTAKDNVPMKLKVRHNIFETTAHIACQSAVDIHAKAIVAFSMSGQTVKRISNYHPPVPTLSLIPRIEVCRQLSILYGTIVQQIEKVSSTDIFFDLAEKKVIELGIAKKGDTIIIVAGHPLEQYGPTNLIKLHQIS